MKILTGVLRLSGLFVLIVVLSSCQKDNDPAMDENFEGSFDLTVTGAESYTFEGTASYSQVIVDGGTPQTQGTTLSMSFTRNEESALSLSLVKIQPTSFGEGTYTYLDEPSEEQAVIALSFYSMESETTYLISSGSVTFDDVSDELIEGSMNVQMTDFMGNNINITGTFKAIGLSLG